jgi:pyruvate kinase
VHRNTKIIGTVGPAVASVEKIDALVASGLDVARLNFSHGTHESHRQFSDWVLQASERQGRAVAVLQDIQGPRIRVGRFPDGAVVVGRGDEIRLRHGSDMAAPGDVYVDALNATEGIAPGHRVLVSDGNVRIEVTSVEGPVVRGKVVEGGRISDQKGAAFPDTPIALPPVTDKDRRDLEFGAEIGVDLVAASFVASPDDIRAVRKLAGGTPVIAKIERAVAHERLEDILTEAAGAMVARGDLGIEMSLQRLPIVQKDIIRRTNIAGRITITATEMLESMTHAWRPTRAEVTDVANAVLDGTDAVMLSAETATGKYPARAVEVMDVVCRDVETAADPFDEGVEFLSQERPFPSALARACVEAANNLALPVIAAFTESGTTARLISKYRPGARIVAFTPIPSTFRRMSLYWGVTPLMIDRLESTDQMINYAERRLHEEGLVERGDGVAVVAGIPPNQASSTNLLKLHTIGEGHAV